MSQFPDPYASPSSEPPRKQGMPIWLWVLLGMLGLGVLSIACCCGGSFYFANRSFTVDPQEIAAMQDEIVTIDIGEPWHPQGAFDMWIMRMVMYETTTPDDGVMVLMDADEEQMGGRDQFERQMRAQLDNSVNQGDQYEPTRVLNSGQRNYTVRGESIRFAFNESEGIVSGTLYYEVSGVIDGNERTAFIYIRAPQESFGEEQIQQMIESIR